MARIILDIPDELHNELKKRSKLEDRSIANFTKNLLKKCLETTNTTEEIEDRSF